MKTYKLLVNEAKDTREIKGLIEVYEELAASKMQKIRQEIINARDFFEGLGRLSDEVGTDLQALPPAPYQDAAVFIAANTGLYGDIVEKTFTLFLDFIKKNLVDIFVIGRVGEQLIKEYGKNFKFNTFALSDDKVEEDILAEIMKKLLTYRKVFVFYGKFQNIAIQVPNFSRVSGELLPQTKENLESLRKKRLSFLYEPSLGVISEVFAQEILSSVFEQIFHESQLAKFGCRLMHLDQSLERIKERLFLIAGEKQRLKKKILDRKQNTMISGIMARK